jgi:exopolyphosphatase / guanosine-5'-triphosphate,3'-diphosphate pyrophosphatase
VITRRPETLREHVKGMVVAAAADIGSTSVHLLVASVDDWRLGTLADESAFLGLGEAVDARSHLGPELIDWLAAAIAGYAERARTLGATHVAFVGTDPLRRAADAATAVHAVGLRSGAALNVLTQHEEATLTLLGVTGGRRVERRMLVVDVGGGSTELVVATPGGRPSVEGLPLGASRLTGQIVRHDPPTRAELDGLMQAARDIVAGAPDEEPGDLVLVGGTATNLLRLMPLSSPAGRLTPRRLAGALDVLARTSSADLVAGQAIRPQRAGLLPAGAAIVAALLERYGSTGARVSVAGVREGTILALARAGAVWRDALPELAVGWR